MEALSWTGGLVPRKEDEISQTVRRESPRLLSFIQQRIPDREEAEDILQDVFYQFTEAYRTVKSIDRVTSWLFTVARNKITDRYRKKKPHNFSEQAVIADDGEASLRLEDMLSDLSSHPESELMRSVIWHAVEDALDEMPEEQREVFVMHEFEDLSFKKISTATNTSVNTLLSRKRYAVLFLRKRLQNLYDDLLD